MTAKNVAEYVKRVADYKLNLQTRKFTNAMRHGLEHLIQPIWLRMFNAEEFQMLIAGKMEKGLDIADLQKNVEFGAGYSPEHPSIKLLWEVRIPHSIPRFHYQKLLSCKMTNQCLSSWILYSSKILQEQNITRILVKLTCRDLTLGQCTI